LDLNPRKATSEHGPRDRLGDEDRNRPAAHGREEDVVRRDDRQHRGIERAIAIEARRPRQQRHHEGQEDADDQGHAGHGIRDRA
jgi:hypothetical protein